MMQTKSPNPKDIASQTKVPLHVFPMTAIMGGSLALFDGLLKYGLANYRATEVNASVYHAAGLRHMFKWYAGEDFDVDMQWVDGVWTDIGSGLPNLWHAIACLAILIDADAAHTLIDDREYPSGFLDMMRMKSSEVARLRAAHADRDPKHYDRRDAVQEITRMSNTREVARRYIISCGAGYYRDLLAECNVTTFSEIPEAVVEREYRLAEASATDTDPSMRELISQG
jgi:hypothetical protein